MESNQAALVQIAQGQAANANQLFQTAFPGFRQAEDFYGTLSTGDPYAIARAIAPATQQIKESTTSAKQNILQNAPSGGEKNLAIEQADVAQGAQVGKTASESYLNSFNALAQLAGQGVGESISAAGEGTYAYGSANQALGQIGSLQIQQKGAQLGALTSLGQDAATVGAAFL
jgi:hypothetical protein